MKRISTIVAIIVIAASQSAAAPPVKFAAPPTARAEGDAVRIQFAVSQPTDVAVCVLDAEGKVVRHLAAGVLGDNAPAPLKAGSLAQSLLWDGKNDLGEAAQGGPFKVRVRAGMGVKFGRTIGGSPYTGAGESIAIDEQGNLYVMMRIYNGHSDEGLITRHIRKFDAEGNYIRTLLPYPASTPPAKASGMKLLDAGDPGLTPANMGSMYPCFYAFGESMHHRTVNGSLLFIHGKNRAHASDGAIAFKLDGSNETSRKRLMWSKKVPLSRYLQPQLAFSEDGRYAYISSTDASGYDDKSPAPAAEKGFPIGRVYRQDLQAGTDPEPFYDLELPDWEQTKYWIPDAWRKKTATAGIDVGPTGHVFIGDMVNQRVVEVSAEGKKISSVDVPWPERLHVHPTTGDIYVVSLKVDKGFISRRGPATLYKITGRGDDAKVAAKLILPARLQNTGMISAFVARGEKAVLWLTGANALIKVEDRGEELVIAKGNILNPPDAISFLTYMDVDPEAELVYVTSASKQVWRYDGRTGEGGRVEGMAATDVAVAPNGMVYTYADKGGYSGPIGRYTRDLKPAPLESTGKHTFGEVYGRLGKSAAVGGLDVDAQGRVYVFWGQNRGHVRVYGPDGKLVDLPRKADIYRMESTVIGREPVLIDGLIPYGQSIRTDLQGNVYIGQLARPKDYAPPKGFQADPGWDNMVGSIFKFGPEGGQMEFPGKGIRQKTGTAKGGLAVYPGYAPISGWQDTSVCACTRPRFDVDAFGRLYIPNAVTFKVSVRDNAGNEILRFGGYQGFDLPKAGEKNAPEIPMGWPVGAAASDNHIYIGDNLNHRVVRADKTWAVDETIDVPR